MTAAEARARIEDDVQWQADPALTTPEVDRLLARARVVDAAGVAPGGTGYADPYTAASLDRAVALGWEWKAGRLAGEAFDVSGDVGAKLSQQIANCERMADRFARRAGTGRAVVGSVGVTTVGVVA